MLDLLGITKEIKVLYIRHAISGQLVMYFRKRKFTEVKRTKKEPTRTQRTTPETLGEQTKAEGKQ